MKKYRAAIVGLSEMGARPMPAGPANPALGVEWEPFHAAMAVSHASAFAVSPDVEVVAACDLKEEALSLFLANYHATWPEVRTYTDFRKMLTDEEPDLLGVATPDHLHAQIVVDAAEAGVRGILLEKPMATSLADADRIIEACTRRGVAVSVDNFRRFRPHWNGALAQLGDGPLGAVRRIVGSYGGPRSMLFRNGSHLIDAIAWFAGGEPEWVVGALDEEHQEYGPRYIGDGGRDAGLDPGGSALVQFDNDVRAFINISKRTVSELELDVFAEEGRLRVNNQTAEVWEALPDTLPPVMVSRTLPPPMTQRADTPGAMADIIQAIEQGRDTVSPPRQARKSLEIILGILQSQVAGATPVRFPIQDA